MQKKQKKKRRKKKKGQKKRLHPKNGGLQNGQEVVPLFFPKKSGFSKFSKTPIFIAFPEKMGGDHFFQKGYVTMRTLLEGQKK